MSANRRKRILETNYGRNCGWIIEREGKVIAILTEPRFEDMFWWSYRMEIVTEDTQLRQQMLAEEFWKGEDYTNLVWRNREFGEVCTKAFPALSPFPEPGRLMMRALDLPLKKAKFSQPYQPLLLRILHGLTGLFAIAAIITAFWTYDVYDGRWGTISLPKFPEIEGIHGTFGLWTLLIFPLFVVYAFHRGQQRLIQSDSFNKLTQFGKPIWWYNLHRLVNTLSILAVTFAVFSGKMMDEKWLPQGELNHSWYYAHLISWLVLVTCIALHVLMSIKIGGLPLILSMINWRFRSKDSPALWREHFYNWRSNFDITMVKQWLSSLSLFKCIEIFVLISIVLAWIISLIKEIGYKIKI